MKHEAWIKPTAVQIVHFGGEVKRGNTNFKRQLTCDRISSQRRHACVSTLGYRQSRIEGTFKKLVYCNLKMKPVCLIIIDLDLEYSNGCILKEAQICLTIESKSLGDGIGKAEDGIRHLPPNQPLYLGPAISLGASNISQPIRACRACGVWDGQGTRDQDRGQEDGGSRIPLACSGTSRTRAAKARLTRG